MSATREQSELSCHFCHGLNVRRVGKKCSNCKTSGSIYSRKIYEVNTPADYFKKHKTYN